MLFRENVSDAAANAIAGFERRLESARVGDEDRQPNVRARA